MKYKMLVTDFDNTLLRTDHTILDKTWKAIKEFERRGGKFVICTGRMLSTILITVKPFDLHGEIIAFQGGVVADLDTGDVLLKKYVEQNDALSLLKDLEEAGYYIQIYSNGDYFVNRYTKRTQRYYEANAHLMPIVVGENVSEYVQKNNLKLDKIVFGLDDDGLVTYDEVQPVMKAFDKKYGGRLVFNSSNTLLIEAVSAGATKGEAVEFVANRHGIAREEVICMGDALNDASMIEWAGLGVAVENATDDLKALADEITVSCDDDAVGYILNKYCL